MEGLTLLRAALFLLGVAVVVTILISAMRQFVLPRGAPDPLTRVVFLAVRRLMELWMFRAHTYAQRDQAMALYAPFSLLALLVTWLAFVLLGYMAMYWALGLEPWWAALTFSGSSLLTLGFATPVNLPTTILAFCEAGTGLILVALLIAYLPTMYSAFSRREAAVTMLQTRAGSPPSAIDMIIRYHRLGWLDQIGDLWVTWEAWFVDIDETHTSLGPLVFFRSPQPDHSWVTAAGCVLDAAALAASTLDQPRSPRAELCLRSGYLALRRISDFFHISYDPDPAPDDPISVTRAEYVAAYDRLAEEGVPLKADRDQAWRDFAGWRVNYDTVLVALAKLTMAPDAPWSSDRLARHLDLPSTRPTSQPG